MSDLFSQPFEDDRSIDDVSEARPGAQRRRIVSVSELTAAVRQALESRFGDIWVEGEISNCRVWHTGHMYFTLKDESAQIRAVMFRSASHYLRFKPEDGLRVVARGRLGIYDAKGEYQIVCEHLEPQGLGALQLAFEQLKKKLQAEGLFARERKRPLPTLPRKIGIVSSLDGAALRDILKVLRRRHPNAQVVIRPTRVQGEGAPVDIARALRAIAAVQGVDVIIAARGGGSAEDLHAFNDEGVARAIAASPIPVISAVGHEVDFTIADFVADVRAPTPSAAAELVVAAKDVFCARIDSLKQRLDGAIRGQLQQRRHRVHLLASRRGLAGWPAALAQRHRQTADISHRLRNAATALVADRHQRFRTLRLALEARDVRRRLAAVRGRLTAAEGRLRAAAVRNRDRADARFRILAGRLDNLSPLAVLARGYAVCWNGDRTAIIHRASQVVAGARVRVTLHEGEIHCDVIRID
jgi:exodeoxyribonuclease VII large subunit